jgi:hypothetical protein
MNIPKDYGGKHYKYAHAGVVEQLRANYANRLVSLYWYTVRFLIFVIAIARFFPQATNIVAGIDFFAGIAQWQPMAFDFGINLPQNRFPVIVRPNIG